MCKEFSDILCELISQLNEIVHELKYIGHGVGGTAGAQVNHALRQLNVFRDSPWAVDRALEMERG